IAYQFDAIQLPLLHRIVLDELVVGVLVGRLGCHGGNLLAGGLVGGTKPPEQEVHHALCILRLLQDDAAVEPEGSAGGRLAFFFGNVESGGGGVNAKGLLGQRAVDIKGGENGSAALEPVAKVVVVIASIKTI